MLVRSDAPQPWGKASAPPNARGCGSGGPGRTSCLGFSCQTRRKSTTTRRTWMETKPVAGVRNLTQLEAAERARLLDVTSYDITLDLTDGTGGPGEGTFRSITEVTFTCAEP